MGTKRSADGKREKRRKREIESKKRQKELYKKTLYEKAPHIRKQLDDNNEITYSNEEHFCRKANATRSLFHFFIDNDDAEERENGEIYISDKHLANIENRCREILAEIGEAEKKAGEREPVKKPEISFSKLLLEFKRYLDSKHIEEARYSPLNYNEFYAESGVKKKYSLPKEMENKFKKLVEKYKRKIGEQDYVTLEVKKEIEKERSESEALKIVKEFITQHKELTDLPGFGVRRADCNPFVWKILTETLECKRPEEKDDEVFVTKENFQHLIEHKDEFMDEDLVDVLPTEKPEKEVGEEIPKKGRERKGLIADRIKEFFRTNEQKWYDRAQIAKALGMPPRSNSLFKNLKKLVREKFLKEKKEENKIHFMRDRVYVCTACSDEKNLAKVEKEELIDDEEGKALGEEKSRGGRPTKEIDEEKIIRLRKDGISLRDIAEELNISHTFVNMVLKKRNVQ